MLVPGGPGQAAQMSDGPVHEWLRPADQASAWTTSGCTGSLILAAAGLLRGRRATSHWLAADQLPAFGVTPAHRRVVVDGKYVTAAGVSAGIDMALALAGRIAGTEAAQAIQLGHECDPQPPYHAGTPDKAPAEIVARLRSRSRFILPGSGEHRAVTQAESDESLGKPLDRLGDSDHAGRLGQPALCEP